MHQLFGDERFPNVVVALDGTVIATWGVKTLLVRRSEDGGDNWGPAIAVGVGIHAGGTTVDEASGDILFFGHDSFSQLKRPTPAAPVSIDGNRLALILVELFDF